jgi:hypothetical protein
VRITITIIIGGRITTGIICIRIMGITMRITIGFTITISKTIRITILTPGSLLLENGADRHMDGPITCSSLTLQGDENQREHRKL